MTASKKRATIRDVAARAGVSPGTVSKALNHSGSVSTDTRARIVAAAEEIDFRPNELARSVFERRSFTVGMITTDSFERFSVPVMLGAEDALGAGRISVFLCDSRDDPIRERHYIDVLMGRRVDGFIVTGRSSNVRAPLPVEPGFPVVYALTPTARPEDCSIVVDDTQVGAVAGEHFVRMGRRSVAHITGPEHFDAVQQRSKGLAGALAAAGLEQAGPTYHGNWSEAWGHQAAQMVLRASPDVDAIYCGSDLIARGVLDGLRDLGRAVPDEIAVIGTDNWEVIATGARPALTTIDTQLAQIGRLAAQRLLDAIAGRPHSGTERVPGRLVLRGSTN
ncbi:LacI family DNA-binding transcriptional regulator [Occultella kanbiaonis]|uniref:LacI family DNA-binding transcriptional regulator n=1 Tax=Occultella kanbiaonis TaxID=2675754 RepID=UPI001A99E27D|nr:LacI family DNA-binding transcriptional regulator [Occultella kanbiaonis]